MTQFTLFDDQDQRTRKNQFFYGEKKKRYLGQSTNLDSSNHETASWSIKRNKQKQIKNYAKLEKSHRRKNWPFLWPPKKKGVGVCVCVDTFLAFLRIKGFWLLMQWALRRLSSPTLRCQQEPDPNNSSLKFLVKERFWRVKPQKNKTKPANKQPQK